MRTAAAPRSRPRAHAKRAKPNPTAVTAVAIGASAGGVESLVAVLRPLPANFGAPILIVLHIDPDKPSHVAELLATQTKLRVEQAKNGVHPEPGTVYMAPPDRHLELRAGRLALTHSPRINFSRPSVDRLFTAVAKTFGPGAIAVVLSGGGADGQAGIQKVKLQGGACFAEEPKGAGQPSMPQAAIATGCIDAVLPADKLGDFILHAVKSRRIQVPPAAWKEAARILKKKAGVDFQGYRPDTLLRQMQGRIAATGMPSADHYVVRLGKDVAELERLRSALLVKVSSFFRDPVQWTALQKRLLKPLMENAQHEVRMWSAGCATGEEAYTLAIASLEASSRKGGFKVFATDVDEPALATGRVGIYSNNAMTGLSKAQARRYFTADEDARRVGPQLRRHVIFGRHDLLRDPPLTGMDVVVCRNVLIYLKPKAREEVLNRFAYALRPGGILFLGPAEGSQVPGIGFKRIAPGLPIFRRVAGKADPHTVNPPWRARRVPKQTGAARELPPGDPIIFAVDGDLNVTLLNHTAETFFMVAGPQVLGASLRTLIPAAPLQSEAVINRALEKRRRVHLSPITVMRAGQRHLLELEAVPMPKVRGLMFIGFATRAAMPAKGTLDPELRDGVQTIGADATGRELQAFNEELQDNAEAQQALNEELQSRNEELETVNEELQSLNDEIQVQGEFARRASLFLRALLDSGPDTVIGCDGRGRVTFWGMPAATRFGLSETQALGNDLLSLVPVLDTAAVRRLLGPKQAKGGLRAKVAGMRVSAFVAADADGKRYGTLLRIRDA